MLTTFRAQQWWNNDAIRNSKLLAANNEYRTQIQTIETLLPY